MIGQISLIVTGRGAYQDVVQQRPPNGVNTVEWENAQPNEASGARAGWPWPAGRAMSISLSRSTA
jgi:hypothetical protein